jgi:hypothetical protein
MTPFLNRQTLAFNFVGAKLKLKDGFRIIEIKLAVIVEKDMEYHLPSPISEALVLMRDREKVGYIAISEAVKERILTFLTAPGPEAAEEACLAGVTLEKIYLERTEKHLWLVFSVESPMDDRLGAWVIARFGSFVCGRIEPQQKDLPLQQAMENVAAQINSGALDTPTTKVRAKVGEGGQ